MGGAIQNHGGQVTIEKSSLFNNHANINGGAIRNKKATASLTITNTTISGNYANEFGGAISNAGDVTNTVAITNVTITNNTAFVEGGGLSQEAGAGIFTSTNTIIHGNLADTSSPDCDAPSATEPLISGGNNILGVATGCENNFAPEMNDQIGVDPLLAALSPADGGDPAGREPRGFTLLGEWRGMKFRVVM